MKQRKTKAEVSYRRALAECTPVKGADSQRVFRQEPEPEIQDRTLRANMRERANARARERLRDV